MKSHLASGEKKKARVTWIYPEGDMQKIKESRTILFLHALDKGDEPYNAMGNITSNSYLFWANFWQEAG